MRAQDLQIGDTVYVRSRRAIEEAHLHVLITPPEGHPPTAIVVHVTSFDSDICEDPTLILQAGDHPFIVHPSYVWYAQAGRIALEPLVQAIEEGYAELRERCASVLLRRIREGFLKSDEPTRRLKRELVGVLQAEAAARDAAKKPEIT